ncbi:E3 ubiquitin-protein ligase SH3RF3-like [Rhipicephalus sanguineus]|uniref:E3 ubiquitin-protein ligase SH3RF3-like n=1 Tax=Rhipicephalus sanguineus TaxID=34632 RepID=UPI0020C429EE|nr:E3 ubiquitin-protein ligase SH3RF3-like [Rhipicephalus sanguineus]
MDEAFLTDLLECSVCLEQLDSTSKVLPCQHTFCRRCLDEIVHSHKELRCPECRILVECSVDELPLNILLVRLLEGIKNNPRRGGGGGSSGGSRSPSGALLGSSSLIGHARPLLASQPSSAGPRGDTTSGRGDGVRTLVKQLVPQMPCAKALYSYDAKDPGDLAFRKGDIIVLRKRVDQNWFHGELGGKQGFVPASYVQVVVPLPSHIPQCKALYDFRMGDNDEKDCLTFLKGDVITVIRRVDENWAEGKLGDRIGIFPISFVEMNAAGKALMKLSNNVQVGPSRVAPPTPNSEAPSQTVIPAGSTPSAGESQSSTTSPASSSPSPGTPPSTSPPLPACQPREKRHSLSALNPPASSNGSNPQAPHRHSMEVLNTGTEVTSQPSSPPRGQAASPSRIPTASSKPAPVTSQGSSGLPLPPPEQPATLLAPLTQQQQPLQPAQHATIASFYVALYSYKPQKEDELELRKNELYSVTEKCQDGWFKGTSLRTGLSGVFPGNYVQPTKSSSGGFSSALLPIPQQQQPQQQQQQQMGTRIPAPSSPRPRLCAPQQVPMVPGGPPPFLGGQGSSPLLAEWALVAPPQRTPLTTTPSPLGHKPPVSHGPVALQVQQLGVAKAVAVTTGSPASSQASSGSTGHWLLAWPPSSASSYGPVSGASTWVPACATPTRSPAVTAATSVGLAGNGGTQSGGMATSNSPHSCSSSSAATSSSAGTLAPSASAMRSEKQKERKEKDKISLMKRLTAKRRSRSPPPPNFSCDNPSFVDSSAAAGQSSLQPPSAVPVVHIRSGSCPSEVLGSQQALHKKTSSLDGNDSLKARPKQPAPLVRERFRCIVPYPPNSEYELELKQGDVVYVHKKREDGWFKGTLQRTGKTGLFPGSFVESF